MGDSFLQKYRTWISMAVIFICAALAITFALVLTKESAVNISRVRPIWTYQCVDNKCQRVEEIDDSSHSSLNVCRMTCGEKIGTLWPYPAVVQWQSNRTLITFNPNKIKFPTRIQRDSTFAGIEDIFVTRIQKKIPEGIQTTSKRELEMVLEYSDDHRNFSFDQHYESYLVSISEQDQSTDNIIVRLSAANIFGIQHGLQTLSQIIVFDERNGELLVPINIVIEDRPVFRHRGISLDTSRNYYPLEAIKRTIDAMSLAKLNVFHWHITDSHSFPLVLESQPDLAKYGAYAPEKVYTKKDIQEVVNFALLRGVAVIPEIDAPAHVGNGWQGTDLVACWNAQPWTSYCLEPPCGQLDPTREKVYEVLADIYNETMEIFSSPHLFHMGGDEVLSACWKNSSRIIEWMSNQTWSQTEDDYLKLWSYFQENALEAFDKSGHTDTPIILWSSTLTQLPHLAEMDRDRYIIQMWGSSSDLSVISTILENKFRVIISNYDALYLDCGFGGWVSDGNNWCSPYIGWHKVYDNRMETVTGSSSSEEMALILGAEAALWSEQSDFHSLDSRLWPRASALAERLWTNPEGGWREAEARMLMHREELVVNGISAESIQPEWCVRNEGHCVP